MMRRDKNVPGLRVLLRGAAIFLLISGDLFAQEGQDIRDIRPPVEMPVSLLFWLIIVGTVVLFLLGFMLLAALFQRGRKTDKVMNRTPWQAANDRLDMLQAKQYPEKGMIKEYYTELSDILRRYIEERFALNAPEMTTEEFLGSLRMSSALNDDEKMRLSRFLSGCDLVKFAKHRTTLAEMKDGFVLVRDFVRSTQPVEAA